MKRQIKDISSDSIKQDLKVLFQTDESVCANVNDQDMDAPAITLERARELFDELGLGQRARRTSTRWTHPSAAALSDDPVAAIIQKARRVVLSAIEKGWGGPPYNPFILAEILGIGLLATEAVVDASTESDKDERFTIKFNPNRPPARMRFSIAHEIGHTLFPDCAQAIRNRATHYDMRGNDWQLESLCNIAAAELLMPFGTLTDELTLKPTVAAILALRRKYLVSCEAVANRLVRLSAYPCRVFFARANKKESRYFVEYEVSSPSLRDAPPIFPGSLLPSTAAASSCTAIRAISGEQADWIPGGDKWSIEYLGISPNTGDTTPRILALASPSAANQPTPPQPFSFVSGDATEPYGSAKKILVQVVNDQAQIWGGGIAKQVRRKWPHAQAAFRSWSCIRGNLRLGNTHSVNLSDDLVLASLVSQHGFGRPTKGPRIRYGALFSALEKTTLLAKQLGAEVHMPRIGAGEAGGSWNIIEGMIADTLVANGVRVIVYDLPSRRNDFERQPSLDFSREVADEVI